MTIPANEMKVTKADSLPEWINPSLTTSLYKKEYALVQKNLSNIKHIRDRMLTIKRIATLSSVSIIVPYYIMSIINIDNVLLLWLPTSGVLLFVWMLCGIAIAAGHEKVKEYVGYSSKGKISLPFDGSEYSTSTIMSLIILPNIIPLILIIGWLGIQFYKLTFKLYDHEVLK